MASQQLGTAAFCAAENDQQLAGGPVTADDNAALLHPLLSPTGCLAGSGDALPQLARRRHEPPHGDEYCVTYLRMAAWLAVLYLVYAEQRLCAWLGLPKDGLQQITFLELFSDVSSIAMYGAVLGWFVGVTDPRRFAWLTTRRRWAAWATLVGTPPVYSAISDVDALKHDLAAVTSWGPAFVALWAAGMGAIAGVVGWHIARVVRRRRWPDAAAYCISRLLLFLFLGGSAAVLRRQSSVDFHLHHLYLGWALALWAELDHWLSALTLAVGVGIWLQGVGSYSFAPVFQESCWTSPSGTTFECKFWADSPFSVTFCPATGPPPSHTCH